jgi:phage terminase large subunit-like protein
MTTDTQDAGNQIDAGLHLRAQKQVRSWSWGWKKKSANLVEAEMEHRWAGLAEWLRTAHSLLDEKPTK